MRSDSISITLSIRNDSLTAEGYIQLTNDERRSFRLYL
jgi:hypothetical protein